MLASKKETKKNAIYGAVLVVVFGAMGYILLSNFGFFSGDGGSSQAKIGLDLQGGQSRKAIKQVKAKASELEYIDTSIFSDKRFQELKDWPAMKIDVSGIKAGKKNPFAPQDN